MRTVWNGYGMLSAANMAYTDVFFLQSAWVVLPETPSLTLQVRMPATTHGVWLWTALASVWFAWDEHPGPIMDPVGGVPVIEDYVFQPGGVLLPNERQLFMLADASLSHELFLVSTSPNVTVLLTALTEIP